MEEVSFKYYKFFYGIGQMYERFFCERIVNGIKNLSSQIELFCSTIFKNKYLNWIELNFFLPPLRTAANNKIIHT